MEKLAFDELAFWVTDNQEAFDRFEPQSVPTQLASAVLLTLYEDQHGDHTPESIHERVSEDFAEIVGSRAGA